MDLEKRDDNTIDSYIHIDSLNKWKAILTHSSDIICVWDSRILLRYANDIFFTSFNLDRSFLSKPIELIFPDSQPLKNALIEAFETGRPQDVNVKFQKESRNEYYYFRLLPEFNRHGTVFNVLGMARDVTNYIETDTSLRRTEALLSEAEMIGNIGSWERNLLTNELIWSEGLYEIYGLDSSVVKPSTNFFLEHVVYPADREKARKHIEEIYKGDFKPIEYRILHPDGNLRTIYATARGYKNQGSEFYLIRGISKDITEQKRIEENMQHAADFVRHIAEATPDIIFIMNIDTKQLIYTNRQFANILGYSEEQTLRMKSPIYDIMHPDDIPGMMDHVDQMRTAADGEVRTIEYRLLDAKGHYHWFIDRNAVFKRDGQGVPVEKIGISHEITDRVEDKARLDELNKALEIRNKELKNLNAELTQFFYVTGHNLKEPLRKAYSFLEMILNKEAPNLTNAGRSYFRRAQGAIQRVNLVTDDIVAYSQINAGLENFGTVDLDDILKQVLVDLSEAIKATNIDIEYDVLPHIRGQKQLLYLLFYHLIDNAIKFSSPKRQPKLSIKFHFENDSKLDEGNLIHIRFTDNGIGFDKNEAERIFMMFEKLDHQAKIKGSGIGLAICKKIAEVHNGKIYVERVSSDGTSFCCVLPVL